MSKVWGGYVKRQTFRVSVLSVASVAALALSACSSSSSSSTSSGASASTGASASSSAAAVANIPYSGPEQNYKTIGAPTVKAGTKCTIGYQDIIESVPAQKAEQDAAGAEAAKLGCKYIALDDQVTPTTQVNNFNQLVAQKVNAIIVFPIVASSLTPSLAKAKAAGIFVLGQSAPVAADDPAIPGYSTNMLHMSDTEAYLRVKSIAAAKPGASFVEMGLAAPVQLLQYYAARTKYWAAKFGLHYLGEIDAAQDNPAGYSQAASAILAKYPTMQALLTFSDNSAVGQDRHLDLRRRRQRGGVQRDQGRHGLQQPAAGLPGLRPDAGRRGLRPDHQAEPAAAGRPRRPGQADHQGERGQLDPHRLTKETVA
jgi:ribose transport system substrate-binding protein